MFKKSMQCLSHQKWVYVFLTDKPPCQIPEQAYGSVHSCLPAWTFYLLSSHHERHILFAHIRKKGGKGGRLYFWTSEAPEEGSPPGLGVTGAATGSVGGGDEATLQKSSALISALMSGNSGTVTTLSMALRGISKYGLEEWMSKFV